jgi:hypothetical protein
MYPVSQADEDLKHIQRTLKGEEKIVWDVYRGLGFAPKVYMRYITD